MNDAEVNFRNVFDRSSKGIKKRNQFGAVLGLVSLFISTIPDTL